MSGISGADKDALRDIVAKAIDGADSVVCNSEADTAEVNVESGVNWKTFVATGHKYIHLDLYTRKDDGRTQE